MRQIYFTNIYLIHALENNCENFQEYTEAGLLCQTAAQCLVQVVGGTFLSRPRMGLTSLPKRQKTKDVQGQG